MLTSNKVMAFVATNDADRARPFYGEVLGLELVEEHQWAIVFRGGGTMIRVQKTKGFEPPPHTALGWEVTDIAATMQGLRARGVEFLAYGFPGQDASGVWTTPDGTKVAWFKDPDGNTLSLTQL